MDYIPHINVGLKSYNFGADKIYVISEKDNVVRRHAFEQAWSIFNDFEFEFVDAIMTRDLDFSQLIKKGELKEFLDPTANVSKTIIAVALSHRKVYKLIRNCKTEQYVMVMEDDARPSQALFDSIQDGTFDKLIRQLNNSTYDCFFWGRGHVGREVIPSTPYDNYLRIPDKFTYLAAQAYTLSTYTAQYLLKEMKPIQLAADTFLDHHSMTLRKTFCASKNYIQQYGFLTHRFHGEPEYDADHLFNVFATSTQIDFPEKDNNRKKYGENYTYVNSDIRKYIKDIVDIDYEYSTGKPGEKLFIEKAKWKKIIFKSFEELSGTASI